jgi:predicted naringenin-chalcone synthase
MQNTLNRPAILAIGAALPRYTDSQTHVGRWMADSFGDNRRIARLVRMIHHQSGIDTRYSCTPAYLQPPQESPLAPGVPPERSATTAERMQIYEREATPLGEAAARQSLRSYADHTGQAIEQVTGGITHLLAISCTGFFAPGLDFMLSRRLGLPATARRAVIGFMGCSAMFNGLRAAAEIVQGQPDARVLVVSVELCSLHTQPSADYDLLVGASIFSDGASACLVGQPTPADSDYFSLQDFYTAVEPDTTEEMAWQIRDHGFVLRLSPKIPNHLASAAPVALRSLFPAQPPQFWAIHPGGRAIVDALAGIFTLPDAALAATRAVLANYGNMSSATILFVLNALRHKLAAPTTGVAMAFGPGLTVEMSRLAYVPAQNGRGASALEPVKLTAPEPAAHA